MTEPGRRVLPVALTVAGADASGGAGVVADCATFRAAGVWPAVAVTAVTAQNTLGVQATEPVSPELVRAQIASVAADLGVAAAKTGMLATAATVARVATTVIELGIGPLVVDPVLVATSGARLLEPGALEVLRSELLPLAAVATPNLAEVEALTGVTVTDRQGMVDAAAALAALGPRAVLVTGGHLGEAEPDRSPDLFLLDGQATWLEGARVRGVGTHGSGCVLSAAVCAALARGEDLLAACRWAKGFVARAITRGAAGAPGVRGAVDPGCEPTPPGGPDGLASRTWPEGGD